MTLIWSNIEDFLKISLIFSGNRLRKTTNKLRKCLLNELKSAVFEKITVIMFLKISIKIKRINKLYALNNFFSKFDKYPIHPC